MLDPHETARDRRLRLERLARELTLPQAATLKLVRAGMGHDAGSVGMQIANRAELGVVRRLETAGLVSITPGSLPKSLGFAKITDDGRGVAGRLADQEGRAHG